MLHHRIRDAIFFPRFLTDRCYISRGRYTLRTYINDVKAAFDLQLRSLVTFIAVNRTIDRGIPRRISAL